MYESLEYPLSELLLGLSELLLYELPDVPGSEEDAGLLYTGAELLADVFRDAELLLPTLALLLTELLVPMPLRTVVVLALLLALDEPDDLDVLKLLPSVCALAP